MQGHLRKMFLRRVQMSPPHKEYKPHPELQKHIDFQKEGMYVPDQPVVGFSPPSTHFWLQARGIEIVEDDDDDDMTLHFDEIDAVAAEVRPSASIALARLYLCQSTLSWLVCISTSTQPCARGIRAGWSGAETMQLSDARSIIICL